MANTDPDIVQPLKVTVVILNYNGWQDTIECLETVMKLDYPNFDVVVVDNNSPNNSLKYLNDWAAGKLEVQVRNTALQHLVYPPEQKPLLTLNYNRYEAEQVIVGSNQPAKLSFIQAGENGGFAAGNNIGIRYALDKCGSDAVWLLNNDTLVEKDALSQLIRYFSGLETKPGILGSKLMYYHKPELIQAIGARYNKWLCTTWHIGAKTEDRGQYVPPFVPSVDYIVGAAMFVSRQFIEDVGLMQEDYFLYFEELDWSFRGKRKGWSIAVCADSKVYHKEGASINAQEVKSELADFYSIRNRLLFTRRFSPEALPLVYFSLIGIALNRIKRKQPKRLGLILKAILGKRF